MSTRDLSLAWTLLEQMGVSRDDRYGPVMIGRELLIRAYALLSMENGVPNSAILMNAAAATFLWGVIEPLPSEYPIDGPEFGSLDAMMWFGITTAVFVPYGGVFQSEDLPTRPTALRAKPDPQSLDVASREFESLGDLEKAGRCSEELGEILKNEQGLNYENPHFIRATELFLRAGSAERSLAAKKRAAETNHPESPFFHRKVGSIASTTISGSREFQVLRSKLKLS